MINWAKLKQQGRVKDIGIPWDKEESRAIRELRIPVDYVRRGVLTLEDYEKAKQEGVGGSKPREEVLKEAKELGIEFVPEVDTETLEREIAKKKESVEKKPKVEAKAAKKAVKAKK